MKTNVAETSIAVYRGHVVPDLQDKQAQRVLNYIAMHLDATIGEIADALDMEKSTVSARQNKLRQDGHIEFSTSRKCRISGITCKPLRIVLGQKELFS